VMKDFPPPKKWKCSCQDFFLPVAASTIDRKSLTRVKLGNWAFYEESRSKNLYHSNKLHRILKHH
jgi:hypothetical protein